MSEYKQKLNPLNNSFNLVPTNTVMTFKAGVANAAALPVTGNTKGDARITNDDGHLYVYSKEVITPVSQLLYTNEDEFVFEENWRSGQTFTVLKTSKISCIKMKMWKVGNPVGDLIIEVQEVDGGMPNGVILGTKTISGEPIINEGSWVEFNFDVPINVTENIQYAFIVRATGVSEGNGYLIWCKSSNPYAGGVHVFTGNDYGYPVLNPDPDYDNYFEIDFIPLDEDVIAPISQLLYTGGDEQIFSEDWRCGQTFTVLKTSKISCIKMKMWKVGNPVGNIITEIQELDIENKPNGVVLGTKTISSDLIINDASWIEFNFDIPIAVTEGIQYVFVVKMTGVDEENGYFVWMGTPNPYSDGVHVFSDNAGAGWSHDPDFDNYFEIDFIPVGLGWVDQGDIIEGTPGEPGEPGEPGADGEVIVNINEQTDDYTLVIEDAGKLIDMNKGSVCTLTIPKNSSVAFEIGTTISVRQMGAGKVTIAPVDGDVTINNPDGLKTTNQYAMAGLIKVATDIWTAFGSLEI